MKDLADAISYHQMVLNAEGRSETTMKHYLFYQRIFLRYLEDEGIEPKIGALNADNLRGALAWYKLQPSNKRTRGGEKTVQTLADIMKMFSRFLETEEIIDHDLTKRVKRPMAVKYLREPFSQTEVAALWGASQLNSSRLRDEAMLLVLLDTGMRIGELVSLTLDKLHLEDRYVIIGAHGKGRRERRVPLGDPGQRDGGRMLRGVRTWLKARPVSDRGRDAVFLGRDGYPFGPQGASDVIRRMGEAAHVPNSYPHRLRHTMATFYLVEHPGDEIGLRRVIGHVSRNVLADYVHFADSIIAQRAGRASLSEAWLGGTKPRVVGQ